MKPFVPEGTPTAATLGTFASPTSVLGDGEPGAFSWYDTAGNRRAPTHVSLQNGSSGDIYFKFNAATVTSDAGGSASESHGKLTAGETRTFPLIGITRVAVLPVGDDAVNVGDGASAVKNIWCLGWFRTASI